MKSVSDDLNIGDKGDCIVKKGPLTLENEGMSFSLTSSGVLTISGQGWLCSVHTPDATPYYEDEDGPTGWSEYVSEFKDMNFHTAIIEEGVKCLDNFCFKDCKSLKTVILPKGLYSIYADFARGASLEYFEENGLLFLGTSENPRHALMGCSDKFNNKLLVIPEGTVIIAHEAFFGKDFIEEIELPKSLVYLGRQSFAGTSIRHLFLPEGELANEEWILAFDSGEFDFSLKSLSFPMSMYDDFLRSKDWYLNLGCDIVFRNSNNLPELSFPALTKETSEDDTSSNVKCTDEEEEDQWLKEILG